MFRVKWKHLCSSLVCLKSSNLASKLVSSRAISGGGIKIEVKEKAKQNAASLKCFQAFGGNYSLSLQIVLVGPKPRFFSVNKIFIQKSPVLRQSLQNPLPGVVHGSNPSEGCLPSSSACADTVYPGKAVEMLGLIILLGHI